MACRIPSQRGRLGADGGGHCEAGQRRGVAGTGTGRAPRAVDCRWAYIFCFVGSRAVESVAILSYDASLCSEM